MKIYEAFNRVFPMVSFTYSQALENGFLTEKRLQKLQSEMKKVQTLQDKLDDLQDDCDILRERVKKLECENGRNQHRAYLAEEEVKRLRMFNPERYEIVEKIATLEDELGVYEKQKQTYETKLKQNEMVIVALSNEVAKTVNNGGE